jgi:hypothetical protein
MHPNHQLEVRAVQCNSWPFISNPLSYQYCLLPGAHLPAAIAYHFPLYMHHRCSMLMFNSFHKETCIVVY